MEKTPIKYKFIWALGLASVLDPAIRYTLSHIPIEEGIHLMPKGNATATIAQLTFLNYYWLSVIENIRPPRLKNFTKMQTIVWPAFFTNKHKHPKRWLDLNLKLEEITFRDQFHREGLLANYHISQGDFELGVQHYQRLLELDSEIKENFFTQVARTLSRPLVNFMFRKGELQDLLEKAQYELKMRDYERMNNIWSEIREKYPSEEIEIIYGVFLKSADLAADEHWKAIVERHSDRLKPFEESRNLVAEICLKDNQGVIVIKKGQSLQKEYRVLKQINRQLPPEERISVVPLAEFEDEENDYLITLRNNSPNLDTMLRNGSSSLEISKRVVRNLRTLNGLKIEELEPYNPTAELQRRLTKRFPENDPRRLLDSYEEFRKKFAKKRIPTQTDLDPRNALGDGTLVDLEKISLGDPWFDLVTFTTHPYQIGIQDQILSDVDLDPSTRPLYEVHVPLCQTGSFAKRSKSTSRYYYELAKLRLKELDEKPLLTATTDYLEKTIDAW